MRRGAILLTGAGGFIGQKVAELLLKKGYEVVGVDNLNDYYDVSLKNSCHKDKKRVNYF